MKHVIASRRNLAALIAGWLAAAPVTGQGAGADLPATADKASVFAGWDVTGHVEAEGRAFFESPLDPRQFDHFDGALAAEVEFFREWEEPGIRFTLTPYGRLDLEDDGRSMFDLREMVAHKVADRWELKVGVSKVFWGVTESQHLVDTINQTDLAANIDGEEKLGQPLVQFSWITDDLGTWSLFYLPFFRERTFPGTNGRLRFVPRVDVDRPVFESELENWHPDVAARWAAYFGEFDVGLHYFYGTSRDPLYQLDAPPLGEPVLLPVYNLMSQGGLDAQWTHEGWLWKLEAIARSGLGQHFQALVGGFEYTFYGVFGSSADIGVIGETHCDSRGDAALTPFNHDLFGGFRLTPNDTQDTALLTGVVWDYENNSTYLRGELERRIGNNYFLNLEAQWFVNSSSEDLLYSLRQDSFVLLSLRRYF